MAPPFFPTNSKKVSFAQTQEVLSGDLNTLSTYLHQIIKDFNINVIGASTELGSTISGMVVTAPNGGPVSVGSGLFIYSATPDTGATSYTGTLVNYPGVSGLAVTSGLPAPTQTVVVGIDIQYTEIPDTVTYTRNFYNTTTNTVDANLTPVDTIPSISTILTFGTPSAGTPIAPAVPSNYCRLATFVVDASGNITNLIYTLTYIWDIQTWAGANTFDPTQMKTLSDSLSALRYQISALIGAGSWTDIPAASIATLAGDITTINSEITTLTTATTVTLPAEIAAINATLSSSSPNIESQIAAIIGLGNWQASPPISLEALATAGVAGFNNIVVISGGSGEWSVPAGVNAIRVQCWAGGGGTGSPGNPVAGGGGGYTEWVGNVATGPRSFSYVIGGGGSTGGGDGGDTTFTQSAYGLSLVANGGKGSANQNQFPSGKWTCNGGGASGGQLNIGGSSGVAYTGNGNADICLGGAPFMGQPVIGISGNNNYGNFPGGGGAGTNGANGGSGLIVIRY